jgi:hypothetical protein
LSWLSELFTSSAAVLVDSVGKAIDSTFTTDEEKLKLKNELTTIITNHEAVMETKAVEYEQEITKRWTSDNEHIVTRLVRPISFVWVIILFTVVMIGDTNWGFVVKDAYIPVLETLLTTMTIAYFGSRGVEKSIKHFKRDK